jgi:hypothetical protein
MALSNWDTLAFNHQGKSSIGCFENKHKDFIEIYKNWVYIHSPSMWVDGRSYDKPVIAELREGSLNICSFEITARRGPQNGIFIFVSLFEEGKKKGQYKHRYFGGIGCSGYVDKVEEILTKLKREKDINDDWTSGSESGPDITSVKEGRWNTQHFIENYKTNEKIIYWDEDKHGNYDSSKDWVGVKKETVAEFFKWLDGLAEDYSDDDMKKWIARCKKSKKLRYNQGNAFFMAHAGMNLEATEVGKSKVPTALKLIAGKSKK